MMRQLLLLLLLAGTHHSLGQLPCTDGPYQLARRFAGTWQEFLVTDGAEKLQGTLTTTFELNGCIITQRFASPDKSFSFMSFGYVDKQTGQWYETYVLSTGRVASYRWVMDGDDILHERVAGGDPAVRWRLRITFVNPDFYKVVEERDAGKGWEKGQVTHTRRAP